MSQLPPSQAEFVQRLEAFRARWRWGRWAAGLLRWLAFGGLALLVYGVADRWLGFGVSQRVVITVLLAVAGAWGLGRLAWRWCGYSSQHAATLADQVSGNHGRIVSALQLMKSSQKQAGTPLQEFLVNRALQAGSAMMGWHEVQASTPHKLLGRAALVLLTVGLVAGGLVATNQEIARVVSQRLLHPQTDLPPYSDLRFNLTPSTPSVIYGEDQLFQCEVTGAEVTQEVTFLVRDQQSGQVATAPSFRESAARFARKLEKVTSPVAIAFAVGKARSDWLPVEIRYLPKITAATLRVTPPAYTNQPARSFALGQEALKILKGSTVEAVLTSNRVLAGGRATISREGKSEPQTVVGEVQTEHSVGLKWVVSESANVSLIVEDLHGSSPSHPLELALQAVTDQAPAVHIQSPQPYVLATERTKIPFIAEIQDDLGLARINALRTLQGFHERTQTEAQGALGLRHDLAQTLDLGKLGVREGQTLEIMLEATDSNPSLMGVGTSEVVKVQIISDADYGARLRLATTLEEYGARFDALAQAVANAKEATKAAQEAQSKGDEAALNAALKQLDAAHGAAQELAQGLADDFQAYAMDEGLAKTAKDIAAAMGKNRADLESLAGKPEPAKAEAVLKQMMERLGGAEAAAKEQQSQAMDVIGAARIMELAARYQELLQNQISLVRRMQALLKEVLEGAPTNQQALDALADLQHSNAEAVKALPDELRLRALQLPASQAELAQHSQVFADKLEALQIPPVMTEAGKSAQDGRLTEALTQAELALRLMRRLLEENAEKNQVASACQGKAPGAGKGCTASASATLQQMLEAMLARINPGQGQGQKPGDGSGVNGRGFGPSGSSMAGQNFPIYGPPRMKFDPKGKSQSGQGQIGKGKGGPGQGGAPALPSNVVASEAQAPAAPAPSRLELTPENYREAVKRYFSRTQP
jgi:hypothetical protein